MPVGGGAVAGRSLRVRKQLDEVHDELQGRRGDRRCHAGGDHPVDTDGAGARDALVDGAGDAKQPKGPIDGAVACDHTIAEACAATADAGAFTFHCAATWGATTSTAYFCGRPQTTVLTETCGTDRELIDTNGSDEYIYVYDSSGTLIAISYVAGGTMHCVAGPEEFVAPVGCSATALFTCHADGGAH